MDKKRARSSKGWALDELWGDLPNWEDEKEEDRLGLVDLFRKVDLIDLAGEELDVIVIDDDDEIMMVEEIINLDGLPYIIDLVGEPMEVMEHSPVSPELVELDTPNFTPFEDFLDSPASPPSEDQQGKDLSVEDFLNSPASPEPSERGRSPASPEPAEQHGVDLPFDAWLDRYVPAPKRPRLG